MGCLTCKVGPSLCNQHEIKKHENTRVRETKYHVWVRVTKQQHCNVCNINLNFHSKSQFTDSSISQELTVGCGVFIMVKSDKSNRTVFMTATNTQSFFFGSIFLTKIWPN